MTLGVGAGPRMRLRRRRFLTGGDRRGARRWKKQGAGSLRRRLVSAAGWDRRPPRPCLATCCGLTLHALRTRLVGVFLAHAFGLGVALGHLALGLGRLGG